MALEFTILALAFPMHVSFLFLTSGFQGPLLEYDHINTETNVGIGCIPISKCPWKSKDKILATLVHFLGVHTRSFSLLDSHFIMLNKLVPQQRLELGL